ncbi:MAG: aspartate--tRNA(Asn) ligase [Nanoarchaeota archaeon]|nr:aspartate--tRNA(Asn) ligase [Nanoarchaeota archaeon]
MTGEIVLHGWVHSIRDMGGLVFFILRNRDGSTQVTAKKEVVPDKLFKEIAGLGREDCVIVHGDFQPAPRAIGGKELIPTKVEIVAKAESPLPLETSEKIESGKHTRFAYRFLDVRHPQISAAMKVRSVVTDAFRKYFLAKGLTEVHTPVIQAAGAEGGSTLFPVVYYNKEAFLRQSPQLYKQILMASGLDRVFEIGPAFRAEKFHTRRHVSEFISVDVELAWIKGMDDVLMFIENMIVEVLKDIKERSKDEFTVLGQEITIPKLPFKRVTYDEALKLLKKANITIEWGSDMDDSQEKVLGDLLAKEGHEWYFITGYPAVSKPFYIMMDGKVSFGFDLAYKGMEISSGGQREHRPKELVKMMKQKGLDPEQFRFYVDAFRYGMPPHGGFGLGLDRVVQQLTGLDNVKEVILFPRTPEMLVP